MARKRKTSTSRMGRAFHLVTYDEMALSKEPHFK
jgi:hypothetical protein